MSLLQGEITLKSATRESSTFLKCCPHDLHSEMVTSALPGLQAAAFPCPLSASTGAKSFKESSLGWIYLL